jgi:hypothetical protein
MLSMQIPPKTSRLFRIAFVIGLIGPIAIHLHYIITRYPDRNRGSGPFYEIAVVAGAIFIILVALFVWFLGLPLITLASELFYRIFGHRSTIEEWHRTTYDSLWTLPYAATLGVVTWIIYDFGKFGGWPADMIFGTFANIIGASVYLTIFRDWYRLEKSLATQSSQ